MGCVQVFVTATYPEDIATFNIADDIKDYIYYGVYGDDVKAGRPFSFNIDKREEKPGTYWVKAVYSPWNDCNGVDNDTFYSLKEGCPEFQLTGKPYSNLEVLLNEYKPERPK